MQKQILDAITSGKIQASTIILGDNIQSQHNIEKVEAGGIGVKIVYQNGEEQIEHPSDQPAEPEPQPSSSLPQQQPLFESELSEGTIDQHKQAFRDAMLKVQNIPYEQEKYKSAIANTYHWYGVLRLAKDIGLVNGYDDLMALMKDHPFHHMPSNPQNFSKYTQYICPLPSFPNWKCPDTASESFFRRFRFIADHTYILYLARCKSLKIRPYGNCPNRAS